MKSASVSELSKIAEKGNEPREGMLPEKMSSMSKLKGRTSVKFKAKRASLSGALSRRKELFAEAPSQLELESRRRDEGCAAGDDDRPASRPPSVAMEVEVASSSGEGGTSREEGGGAAEGSSGADSAPAATNGDAQPKVGAVGGKLTSHVAKMKRKSSVAKIKQKIRDRVPTLPTPRGDKGGEGALEEEEPLGGDSDDDHSFAFSDVHGHYDHDSDDASDDDGDDDISREDRGAVDGGDDSSPSAGTIEEKGTEAVGGVVDPELENNDAGGALDSDLESLPSIGNREAGDTRGAEEEEESNSLLGRDDYVDVLESHELRELRRQLSQSEEDNRRLERKLEQARRPESEAATTREDTEMKLREEIERMRMDLVEAAREGEDWRRANERQRDEAERLREELARTTTIVERQRGCREENERLQLKLKRATQNSETLVNELRSSQSQGNALPFFEIRLRELLSELEQRDLEVQCLREEIGELKAHIIEQQMSLLPSEGPDGSGGIKGGEDKWGVRLSDKIVSLQVKEKVGSSLGGMGGKIGSGLRSVEEKIMARRARQQQQQQHQQQQHESGDSQKEISPKYSDKENRVTGASFPRNTSHDLAQSSIESIVDNLLEGNKGSPGHDRKSRGEFRSPLEKPHVPKPKWTKNHKEKLRELTARDSLSARGGEVSAGAKLARGQHPQSAAAKEGENVDNILALFQGPPKSLAAPTVSC